LNSNRRPLNEGGVIVKAQLENRLSELKSEYDSGYKVLEGLEEKQTELKGTLLRISGAIQVLEELLEQKTDGEGILKPVRSSDVEKEQIAAG
jgi:predicted nuclease with TOPRIM domain